MCKIIGIGETVLDIIFKNDQPQAAVPGGSTFNGIVSLGRVGVPCCIVTEAGNDHVGDITCKYLRDNGVDSTYVVRSKGMKSHISLAFLDENNDAHYQFYKDHANVSISDSFPAMTSCDFVLFGSFFAINPAIRHEVRSMLQKAHESGATLYYDINFRASHIADIPDVIGNLQENMALSSVVRGSLEDFVYLYGREIEDDKAYVDYIYEKHIAPFCPCFICTNGGKSVELRTPSLNGSFAVKPIETVSTIGAGDNFNAGFLYALRLTDFRSDLSHLTLEEWSPLIASGQMFSTDVCQQFGNSVSKAFVERINAKS